MIIASADIATRQAHWFAQLSAFVAVALLLAAIYLTARSLLTKSDKISTAPHHVRRAPSILKWIAVFAPLLTFVGGTFELYAGILRAGYTKIDITTAYILLGQFIPWPTMGLIVTLSALCGIGLIFLRHRQ